MTENYTFPEEKWEDIDPEYHSDEIITTNITPGGSEETEIQTEKKSGLAGIFQHFHSESTSNRQDRWKLFGKHEVLLAEYNAKTAFQSGEHSLKGWIFIARNYFGWISHSDSQNRVVKTIIPISNVAKIIPTVRNKEVAKYAMIEAPEGSHPQGFNILTKDNMIYSFLGLKKPDQTINLLKSQLLYCSGSKEEIEAKKSTEGYFPQHSAAAHNQYLRSSVDYGYSQPVMGHTAPIASEAY
eukprot:TRINITY_DN2012_c0_g1_i1.p1 TRINITY_DN2012_c0_g1~~TRINITY_DN2012_c0_g1_i1.p1  ORF type:complete len:240 (-),score=71.83 TRINITY_DN2012_c0_g1_i1:65-784(-)